MSLITRCPTCQTTFRVVPDQLRVSEGWVRCGQCNQVFDAAAHLQGDAAPPPVLTQPPEPPLPPHPGDIEAAPVSTIVPSPETRQSQLPFETTSQAQATSVPGDAQEAVPVIDLRGSSGAVAAPPGPSFLRAATLTQATLSPWRWAGLLLLSLCLALGLALQVLLHERDRVAAIAPPLRPALAQLCQLMDCTLAPLRRIESIVMDSSSFNKLRGDVYKLSLTLKNTADIALALPAIELAVTDVQDQAVLRRVFLPNELGWASAQLGAGADTSATLTLRINAPGNPTRIAGYRVLAFYP